MHWKLKETLILLSLTVISVDLVMAGIYLYKQVF
jgi:hypothetical protein